MVYIGIFRLGRAGSQPRLGCQLTLFFRPEIYVEQNAAQCDSLCHGANYQPWPLRAALRGIGQQPWGSGAPRSPLSEGAAWAGHSAFGTAAEGTGFIRCRLKQYRGLPGNPLPGPQGSDVQRRNSINFPNSIVIISPTTPLSSVIPDLHLLAALCRAAGGHC